MSGRFVAMSAFIILCLLWLGFGFGLVFQRDLLDSAWAALRSWPIVAQVVVWLLALPVVLALWVWQTSWPWVLRLILVIGLAVATTYTFFPRSVGAQRGMAVKHT